MPHGCTRNPAAYARQSGSVGVTDESTSGERDGDDPDEDDEQNQYGGSTQDADAVEQTERVSDGEEPEGEADDGDEDDQEGERSSADDSDGPDGR